MVLISLLYSLFLIADIPTVVVSSTTTATAQTAANVLPAAANQETKRTTAVSGKNRHHHHAKTTTATISSSSETPPTSHLNHLAELNENSGKIAHKSSSSSSVVPRYHSIVPPTSGSVNRLTHLHWPLWPFAGATLALAVASISRLIRSP